MHSRLLLLLGALPILACEDAADKAGNLLAAACETRSDCADGERCIDGACVRPTPQRDSGIAVAADARLPDPDDGVLRVDAEPTPDEPDAIPFLDVGPADEDSGVGPVGGDVPPPERDARVPDPPPNGPCEFVNDNVCDEPGGTGMCAEGTDPADCRGLPGGACEGGADCAPDERCDLESGTCVPVGGGGGGDCPFANDGFCDEPLDCAPGTDGADCGGGGGGECLDDRDCGPGGLCLNGFCFGGGGGCIFTNDDECDESEGTGACPEGSDVADCAGGGGGACPPAWVNDGECDDVSVGGPCPLGSDGNDCDGGGFECFIDQDCAPGELCDFGVCRPDVPGACIADFECDFGEVCQNGACVAAPPEACRQDFDCGVNEVCIEAVCTRIGDGTEDSLCNPNIDLCLFELVCVPRAEGGGVCRPGCDAFDPQPACGANEACVPLDRCIAGFRTCDGACVPSDGCNGLNNEEVCGGPSGCAVYPPATLCTPVGNVPFGRACDPAAGQNCAAGLLCQYGACLPPCSAEAACPGMPASLQCVDYSARVPGLSFCLEVCDPIAQAGCLANQRCAVIEQLGEGPDARLLSACIDDVRDGDGVQGDSCFGADALEYWGDCTAAHVCAPLEEDGVNQCGAICTAEDTSGCAPGGTCYFGLLNLPALGVCLGECDPFGGQGCGPREVCRPTRPRPGDAANLVVGTCTNDNDDAADGERCFESFEPGRSDCAAGYACVSPAGANDLCRRLCDDTHPCPAGVMCRGGVLGTPALGYCDG